MRRCSKCSRPFTPPNLKGPGRPRTVCDRCHDLERGPNSRRTKDREGRLRLRVTHPGEEPETLEPDTEPRPAEATWAERLAVGLHLVPDDLEAAAVAVGLGFLSRADLDELAIRARKHVDLIDGRGAAIARQLHATLALAALELRARTEQLSAASLGATIKSLTVAIESFQGGAQRIYSDVHIHLPSDEVPADEVEAYADRPE